MTCDYDVVVVGGGPGGSTAGAFLANAGKKVLILEKEIFPRFHIGESLLPFGNDVLKASGAWEKVEAAGFLPKYGAEFMTGNGSKFNRFWFSKGFIPGHGQTFQVERAKFDHILLQHAAACGCDVKEGCVAKSLEQDERGINVVYDPGSVRIRARWLVDASGRDTFLGRTQRLARAKLEIPKRIAVYAHFTGVFRNEGEAAGHIAIVRLKDGWFWLIPLAGEKTSVGMVRTLGDFDKAKETIEDWFARTVEESSEVRNRMMHAKRVGQFYTTSDYSYRFREFAGLRTLLVGDAGGFVDPIFSSGVFLATRTAQMAVETLLRADGENRGLSIREQCRYSREMRRIMNIYLRMIRAYYDNPSFEVLMNPLDRMGFVQTVASILAGHTKRSFSLWWRVNLFFLVCRLQRHMPVVPRLDFNEQPRQRQMVHP